MKRVRWTGTVWFCLALVPTGLDAQTKWTVTTQTDKLTDKTVLTATAQVPVGGPSTPIYELAQKCDGSASLPAATLATFDGAQRPRPILLWERRFVDVSPNGAALLGVHVENGIMTSKDIRYRVDDERVKTITLEGTDYSNAGQAQFLHAQPSLQIATAFAGLDKLATALGVPPDSIGLPHTRLLIADVFPDETVELSFAALTAKQRNDIYHWCFEPAEKAIAKTKAADEKAAADKKLAEETARQRVVEEAQAKAARMKAALKQQCRTVSPLPAEFASYQVHVGDKWKPLTSVWPQAQCASEEAVRRVLGEPDVSTTPEGLTVWQYEVRVGGLLKGHRSGTVVFYVVDGVVAYPF